MSDPFLSERRELAAALEATKGTAIATSAMTDGTNSKFLVLNLKVEPMFDMHKRAIQSASLSKYPPITGKQPVKLTFTIEARATAAAGTADAWDTLLKGCGALDTNVAVTSDTYTPSSDGSDHRTLTMWAWVGSFGAVAESNTAVRVGIKGAAGTYTYRGKVGETAFYDFEFMGVYNGAVDTSLNSVTHETGTPPIFQGVAFTYGGASRVLSSLSYSIGNTLTARESVNVAEGILHYAITARELTGKIDPDMELVATEAFHAQMVANTAKALAWSQTKLAYSLPKIYITKVNDENLNGIQKAGLDFVGARSAVGGEDEWSIVKT